MTRQICDIHSKHFYDTWRMGHKGPKYMYFITSTTEGLCFLQMRPCLGAKHGDHGIFGVPKWLEHQTGLDNRPK